MINIKKLFKIEGTHKGKVKVTRGGKTFYREQMVGRKEKDRQYVIELKKDGISQSDQVSIENLNKYLKSFKSGTTVKITVK